MTFRIEAASSGRSTVFMLSGRIDAQATAELTKLFELQADYRDVVVDLRDVTLVAREAVLLLARCEADGVRLANCTRYVREWIKRERAP
jgi:anti-anti-sigma regulatory factor